jgi:hypothetical protein
VPTPRFPKPGILTMNQHVVGTTQTYEMAGRLLLGLEPLRWLV